MASLKTLLGEAARRFQGGDEIDCQTFCQYDHDFHFSLVRLCGNDRMVDFYESLNTHVEVARVYLLMAAVERHVLVQEEHEAIFDAYEKRDLKAVRAAQARHLKLSLEGLLNVMGTQPML